MAPKMRIEGCHAAGASPAARTWKARACGDAVVVGPAFALLPALARLIVRVLHRGVVTGLATAQPVAVDTVTRAVTG